LLPVLKQAGVVDSGGQGLVVLLEGIYSHIDGKPLPIPYVHSKSINTDWITSQSTSNDYGFCTEFVIQGMNTPFEDVQSALRNLGESEGLIGDISLARVHIHTNDPDAILKYGESVGRLEQVSIRDMEQQHEQFLSFHDKTDLAIASGVVAVASGAGFASIMRSLGASAVVWGGQTMNPSVEDLLIAIESVPSNDVILLPNNKNIVRTGEQTRSVTGKNIHVIPTKSMVEGIAALIAFLQDAPADQNVPDMTEASSTEWGEITHAVRTTQINGLPLDAGSPIGIANDTIIATGATSEEALLNLCNHLKVKTDTLLSVYYGSEVKDSTVEDITMRLRSAFPKSEIELLYGGQPHYPYIVSVDNDNDS
jgi:DAK2 domain fusion protein YloV